MINFKDLISNESVSDVIVFFAGLSKNIGYPEVDRYFTRYKSSSIENGEFMNTFQNLSKAGVVALGEKMSVVKGPNWKEPTFVAQKKYGIE